jgi:2Fe-2S ferredoxin
MPQITILPLDVTISAESGQTVMEAAQAAGYYWPTSCGGNGECTTCAGLVISGAECLSEMGRYERQNIVRQRGRAALDSALRLCCQARVSGDVIIRKPGVQPW